MYFLILISTLFYFSCASQKEIIQGYSGAELTEVLNLIDQKSPRQVIEIMGYPVVKGVCRKCGPKPIYRMIYPSKDMSRFHINLTTNTDNTMDCVVLDFFPNSKEKKYLFDKMKGLRKLRNCNQNAGAIGEFKSLLDLQDQESKDLSKR